MECTRVKTSPAANVAFAVFFSAIVLHEQFARRVRQMSCAAVLPS